MDQILLFYNRTRDDLQWLIKLRSATNNVKTAMILSKDYDSIHRIVKTYYHSSDLELESMLETANNEVNKKLSEVNINQVL